MTPTNPQRDILYHGRRIQVALESGTAADGTPYQRDVVIHPGAVAILPLVDAGHFCLVRNQRPAVGETLLEIPAGTLEIGEAPEAAAIRELAEETGYSASRWEKLTEFYPSPGVLSEKTHLFIASELMSGEMSLEADEDLQPCIVSCTDALQWALNGTIRDAKTLVALLLWARR